MLLAIDTATNLAGIALLDESGLRGAIQWQTGRNHTVELMPNIIRLLAEARARPDQLEAVAVAIGPGSYTGLRIGLSVAKGFCLAHGAALLAEPTLDISAAGTALHDGLLCAILQAGRGRLAAGFYRAQAGRWQRSGELFYGRAPELAQQSAALLDSRVVDATPPVAGHPAGEESAHAGTRLGPSAARQQSSSPLHPRVDDAGPSSAGQQHITLGETDQGLSPLQNVYFAGELDAETVQVLRAQLAARASFAPEDARARDPRVLARLGWERLRQGLRDDLETLAPAYGR